MEPQWLPFQVLKTITYTEQVAFLLVRQRLGVQVGGQTTTSKKSIDTMNILQY